MKQEIKTISLGLALVIGGGLTSVSIYKYFEKEHPPQIISKSAVNQAHLVNSKSSSMQPTNLELAANMSLNAVVHVKTEVLQNRPIDPFFQYFYGGKLEPSIAKSSGSGVIISDDGFIVTNNHVIDKAENISITLNNNKSYPAEVIGTDPTTDLALIKIDEEGLPFLSYGNSNEINIGEWVLAVGNPYNLTSTVTAGIVSAKSRDIDILQNDPYSGMSAIESFIQTDAAVNPGNSGGALVSSTGELIGINSAIQSRTGSYSGYSFAIPVNIVKKVVKDLKEFGNVQRAFIGVNITNLDENLANEIGIEDVNGVYINGTTENGSAAEAGIESGDVIKMVGNKPIKNVAELQEQISQFRPGDKVMITLNRKGTIKELPVTLKNLNGNENIIKSNSNKAIKLLGAQLNKVDKNVLKQLKIKNGIKVTELYNGKLRSVGVRKGFIITSINRKPLNSLDDINQIIDNAKGGILIEGIYENGRREYYAFGI
ncbi:MAG: trypsin-like peptidase domain-containing protein [Vicingaceae bacterium]